MGESVGDQNADLDTPLENDVDSDKDIVSTTKNINDFRSVTQDKKLPTPNIVNEMDESLFTDKIIQNENSNAGDNLNSKPPVDNGIADQVHQTDQNQNKEQELEANVKILRFKKMLLYI